MIKQNISQTNVSIIIVVIANRLMIMERGKTMFEKGKAKAIIPQLFEISNDLFQEITGVDEIPMASVYDTDDAVIALAWEMAELFRKDKKVGIEIAKQGTLQKGGFINAARGGAESIAQGIQTAYKKYSDTFVEIAKNCADDTNNTMAVYNKIREGFATVMAEVIGDVYGYGGNSVEICGKAVDRIFSLLIV